MPRYTRPLPLLAALAIGAAVCAPMSGCIIATNQATVPAATTVAMPMAAPVGVDVKTSNGRITITQNPAASEATVSAEARLATTERAERFTIETVLQDDGTLRVRPVWPDGKRLNNEACSFEITAPALHAIVADTSNGAITLRGGVGDARLDTSNGAIRVQDRQGDVFADTSNGRIEVAQCVGNLDLDTSNGAVSITACQPQSSQNYAWRVATSNGSITIELDQALEARLRATTSNGKARLERTSEQGALTLASGRSIEAGEGPGEVTLKTSNGAITVRTR